MGGLNPHPPKNTNKNGVFENWCGLDWLTLTLWIKWGANWATEATSEKNWRGGEKVAGTLDLREILDFHQLKAMACGEPVEIPELGNVLIHPGGGKIAKKYCRFKLELDCAVILIADQPGFRGDWPNVKVEITGNHCLCYTGGAPEAYRDALNFIEQELCAVIHKERVGRVDLCADFPGWAMWRFIPWAMRGRYTCRSKLFHPYLKQGASSLYWGTGALILRVYDKLGEMQEKALRGQPAKYQHMVEKRWGGVEPARAIRVEFQIRRDSLKGFGITDFDSLMNRHGELIRYLTGASGATLKRWRKNKDRFETQKNARWFRFLKKRPNHKHPERNKTYPQWKRVQDVFLNNFMNPETMVEIRPEEADIETLLKQAFGVLETAASNTGYAIPGKKSFAPQKFEFPHYAAFESWILDNLKTIAAQRPGWGIELEKANQEDDSYDLEVLERFQPSEEYLVSVQLEIEAEADKELEAIGLL